MHLPQELIDKIIGHLPPGHKSLHNPSLVAKTWAYPSQRRLFESVYIMADRALESWLINISPTNVELLQHVRSLSYLSHSDRGPTALAEFFHDYSFPHLRRLDLFWGYLPESLPRIGTFSAFQHTLEHLYLCDCTVSINGLSRLINYFPNLVHLELDRPLSPVDDQQIPSPLVRPLRKLTVVGTYINNDLGPIGELLELQPQCDEVSIDMHVLVAPSVIQRVIKGVEASVKHLNLRGGIDCVCNIPKSFRGSC